MNFDRSLDVAPGTLVPLSPLVSRLLAPNPGPFTFKGTGVHIIGAGRQVAVIDPGPALPGHIEALKQALGARQVSHILVTHTHRDHSSLAARLKAATSAPIVGARPHAFAEENSLFSGDHVMAWSTSVVAPPDGSMTDYMASLDKLRGRNETIYWPGHGGHVTDPERYLRALTGHRRQREASILARLDGGPLTIPEIVATVYAGIDPKLFGAAGLSTRAHLEDLMRRGMVTEEGGRYGKLLGGRS